MEAELVNHQLMLKAGFIYRVASGIYSYMPLAWRSLRKIEKIIRDEVEAAGGQELRMSVLQPRELWQESGRYDGYGPEMFRLEDRRGRHLVMAPTHEELLTNMVKAHVNSYRDLPLILFQIQTKFRDEPRPRGGLIRVREFDMKDAYSFDVDQDGLDVSYQSMMQVYKNIYERCGLPVVMVEADSGTIGGKDSQEFVVLADSGEDTVVVCPSCHYAANTEKAEFTKLPQAIETQEAADEIYTPDIKTIQDLAVFLKIDATKTLKVVSYVADGNVVVATLRGDLDVNEVKLRNILGVSELRIATSEEMKEVGLVTGFASPVGLSGLKVIADDSVQLGSNFVIGANKKDHHIRNANYSRDFEADIIGDIALAKDGYGCPKCSSDLTLRRGIEVGHVFKLGTKYSELLGAYFSGQDDSRHPIIMGCYGIGVGRILAAVIENSHDGKGMILPRSIAPYDVCLVALKVEDQEVARTSDRIYEDLKRAGIEVLYDDRPESAGVKFNDADLLGLPLRLVVSPRNLRKNTVEIKTRSGGEVISVSLSEIVGRVKDLL